MRGKLDEIIIQGKEGDERMKLHVVDTPIYTDEELLELWEKYSDESKGYYDGPPPYIGKMTLEQYNMISELNRKRAKEIDMEVQRFLKRKRR